MIDLKTGTISFPELQLSLQPFSTRHFLQEQCPENRYHEMKSPESSYTWFGLKERICREDTVIPVWLRYSREGLLESVELFPQFGNTEEAQGLPQDALDTEQNYCAAWLQRFCGLSWRESGFPWGIIRTDYDARSDSCGIVIRYTKPERSEKN